MELSPRFKKIILIIALLAVTGLIIFAIYWVIFREPTEPGVDNVNGLVNGQLPNTNALVNRPVTDLNVNAALPGTGVAPPDQVAAGGDTIAQTLVANLTTSVTLGPSGTDLQYYDPAKGQFFRISSDGRTKQLLSPAVFAQVQEVTWSPDGNKAVMEFPDGSKIVYDFSKRQQSTLPVELNDFSFSPDSNMLAFKFTGATLDDQWLAISNADGTSAQLIEEVGDQAPLVDSDWSPNQQMIATYSKSISGSQQEIIFLGQYGENFQSLQVNGRGFESQWSPSGELLLYSTHSADANYNPTLHITRAQGDTIGESNYSLNVQTWSDKCAFGATGSSVICAVPSYLPTGAGLRRELTYGIPDDIFEINLATGSRRLLASPIATDGFTKYSVSDMKLSADGTTIFFTDEITGQLLSLRLK
ncbi:hypothetical protein ACFL04_03715 [Patescibacteria group bacterium]